EKMIAKLPRRLRPQYANGKFQCSSGIADVQQHIVPAFLSEGYLHVPPSGQSISHITFKDQHLLRFGAVGKHHYGLIWQAYVGFVELDFFNFPALYHSGRSRLSLW